MASADTVSSPYREGHHDGEPGDAAESGEGADGQSQHHPEREMQQVIECCQVRQCGEKAPPTNQASRFTRNSSLSHVLTQVRALCGTSVASS